MKIPKKALLVTGNIGFKDDIELMFKLLRRHSYEVKVVWPTNATCMNIHHELSEIAKDSNDRSQTIFYFAGHGNVLNYSDESGKEVIYPILNLQKEYITPYLLFSKLGRIKGKKAVILDCCYSGGFIDALKEKDLANSIEDYVVIAACPYKEKSYSRLGEDHRGKVLDVGTLTYSLYYSIHNLNFQTELIERGKKRIFLKKNLATLKRIFLKNNLATLKLPQVIQDSYSIYFGYPHKLNAQRAYDTDFIL